MGDSRPDDLRTEGPDISSRWTSRIFPHWMESLVFSHVGVLIVGTSWWFGGQSPGARHALLVWGTLGIALFIFALQRLRESEADHWQPLRHLWPLLVFDLLVGISCFNSSTGTAIHQGELLLTHITPRWPWLPSSARPELTVRELWQFNGIVLSCYNVLLVFQRRSRLRQLLALVALNALVLAVFGTFQKLTRAGGLYFGFVPSPQPYFFSSFVYHNHWGAFTVLNLAACLGLLFHQLNRGRYRDFWHSPAFLGGVAIAFLALTAPLSGSRSATVICGLLVLGAFGHYLKGAIRRRRERRESRTIVVIASFLTLAVFAFACGYLSRDVMKARLQITNHQVAQIEKSESNYLRFRLRLYRDTWAMAQSKPLFGWGLETYGHAFMIFNTAPVSEGGGAKPYFDEAHNDWLQALAEVGFAGTTALVLLGLAPFFGLKARQLKSSIPRYLLIGCGVILAYAWVEFPLANPSVMIAFWTSLFVAVRYATLSAQESAAA